MELDRGFLILHNGKARFEFKKVDGIFRIRLPQATLGILGTTLDVEVSKDGASQICLLEGIIEIKSSSGNITLKQGNLITISAGGTISAPQKLPDLNQGTVHPR